MSQQQQAHTHNLSADGEPTPEILTAACIAYNAITDLAIRHGRIAPEDATHWSGLTAAEKEEVCACVKSVLGDRIRGAQVIHEAWVFQMKRQGWSFAHEEDRENKKSPMVRSWRGLEAFERIRMRLFFQIVTTLIV